MTDYQPLTIKYGLALLILILATIAAYYPILFNDFLYYWDDQWQVMNHYTEEGITFGNLWAIFSEFFGGQYSPVNETMYLFIYSLFGYNPMPFHLASLLLHIGCVCLAYIIIIRIFAQTTRITFAHAPLVAFITALLFAVHPMKVESVAWISASKIPVYAFFYLLATYTYIIYLDRKKTGFYILTILLFALSFGGKEQAVTFPVWLLMLYWMLGRSLKDRKVWIQLAPFFAMAIFFGIVTMLSQYANGAGVLSNASTYPLWQRFILGCYSLTEYLVKFITPYNLLYIYPYPMEVGDPLPTWMLLYPACISIILVTLWNYVKRLPLSLGLIFFLLHIALVLQILPLSRFAVIADRYVYLASIGLSLIVAWYLAAFLTDRRRSTRIIAIGSLIFITSFLAIYSNIRCRDWKDVDSIKKEIRELLKKREDYVAPDFEKLIEYKSKENSETSYEEPDKKSGSISKIEYENKKKAHIVSCNLLIKFFKL